MVFPRVPYPLRDGGAIAMMQMIKGLHACGADLTLFFLNTSKHFVKEAIVNERFSSYGKVYSVSINNDVTVKGAVSNLFSSESYHISRFKDEVAFDQMRNVLENSEFDTIHFDGLQSSVFLKLAQEISLARCVLRQHNIEHLIWERNAKNAGFVKKQYLKILAERLKSYEEGVLPKFDAIVPISSVDANYFQKFNKRLFVTSTGIDSNQNVGDISLKAKTVFHIGSLDWMPNQEGVKWFLNEIWPLILEKDSSFQFKLAGRNISDSFVEFAEGFQNVQVVGEVDDAKEFITQNGLMIVPLKAGSGVRIKILEGLALGVPIVTTEIGVEGIEVDNGEEIFIANDPEEFAKVILEFNHEKFLSITNKARLFIRENFDNSVISQRLLGFYSSIGKKV